MKASWAGLSPTGRVAVLVGIAAAAVTLVATARHDLARRDWLRYAAIRRFGTRRRGSPEEQSPTSWQGAGPTSGSPRTIG